MAVFGQHVAGVEVYQLAHQFVWRQLRKVAVQRLVDRFIWFFTQRIIVRFVARFVRIVRVEFEVRPFERHRVSGGRVAVDRVAVQVVRTIQRMTIDRMTVQRMNGQIVHRFHFGQVMRIAVRQFRVHHRVFRAFASTRVRVVVWIVGRIVVERIVVGRIVVGFREEMMR